MKVLIIGGTGYIGGVIANRLKTIDAMQPVIAARHVHAQSANPHSKVTSITLDATDLPALEQAIKNVDAIVNCVAGNAATIVENASSLAKALSNIDSKPKVIHLSTMSVYGSQQGSVKEDARLIPDIGWYGEAKIQAETLLSNCPNYDSPIYILRLGNVYGPGSEQWVDRIKQLINAGRLGDIGANGDGWSNLVHVEDVAKAVACCLMEERKAELKIFNVSAPDSPRWNQYFGDMAMLLGAVPLKYLSNRRIQLETKLLAPPLKVLEKIFKKIRINHIPLPVAIPPSLLSLWKRQIKLDSRAFERIFDFSWTSYEQGLKDLQYYFAGHDAAAKSGAAPIDDRLAPSNRFASTK